MLQRDTEELGGEAGATLAAGVFEAGGRRRDCGPSASITSTHLLPRPATSRLWPHASHTAPGGSGVGSNPSPLASHHLIIPLLLINIHRLWALELLLSCCLLFAHSLEYSAHTLHRLHGLVVVYSHGPTVCYRSSCFLDLK